MVPAQAALRGVDEAAEAGAAATPSSANAPATVARAFRCRRVMDLSSFAILPRPMVRAVAGVRLVGYRDPLRAPGAVVGRWGHHADGGRRANREAHPSCRAGSGERGSSAQPVHG